MTEVLIVLVTPIAILFVLTMVMERLLSTFAAVADFVRSVLP